MQKISIKFLALRKQLMIELNNVLTTVLNNYLYLLINYIKNKEGSRARSSEQMLVFYKIYKIRTVFFLICNLENKKVQNLISYVINWNIVIKFIQLTINFKVF